MIWHHHMFIETDAFVMFRDLSPTRIGRAAQF
jgi:hypothetical protein